MTPQRPSFLVCLALAFAMACSTPANAPEGPQVPRSTLKPRAFRQMVCGLDAALVERTWEGYYPGRSGDIQIIPDEPATFGVSHSGPWEYLQRIPIFLYGPNHVPSGREVSRPVTIADLAPTMARYMGFDFQARDGRLMEEAVSTEAAEPPRLIVVVVWDGGGRNLLAEYPDAWPNLRRLIPGGVWFERATVGSSPSVTPPVHATLGTGAFPRHHGLVDFVYRVDGRIVNAYETGPQDLMVPSLADEWDVARGNEPVVGMLAYKNWHLGMLGHGSLFEGGDDDIAVVVDEKIGRWGLNRDNRRFFRFPTYLNEVDGLDDAVAMADALDGLRDGLYFGEDDLGDPNFVWRTPAFARWQTQVLEEMIRREGFGADEITDLLFVNYKQIDQAGHLWTMNSRQMETAVEASDRELARLVSSLNSLVGRGRWVLALTADHGTTPNPLVSGAYTISKEQLVQHIEEAFADGEPGGLVQRFGRTHLWIDVRELESRGYTLRQVAAFVARYTKGRNTLRPAALPPGERNERVFAAAFPSEVMRSVPCLRRVRG